MSQLLDLAGTIGLIVGSFVIVLGVIWRLQSSPDDSIESALPARRSRPDRPNSDDDLRLFMEDIEEKLELHRKHIVRAERRIRGVGIIIFSLTCACVSLYALGRNDWIPGLSFLAMGLSFGTYGLVNLFSSKSGDRTS